MKKILLLVVMVFAVNAGLHAQTAESDTTLVMTLKEVQVKSTFLNDTDRYRYNQMKFYVTTVLPYVNAATKLFNEVNAKVNNEHVSRKERRQFINGKEDEMRTQFEDKVKSLNTTQGVLLVKLIARQTDVNIYKMLLEFKNPFTAVKWQAWARLNGMNLDKKYNPDNEPMLENIMDELGYPLPAGYALVK